MNPLSTLLTQKQRGEKIAMLTCYDASFASLMGAAGVDVLLVGDFLGLVLHGAADTLNVSMQDMLYHTRCVAAGSKSLPIITDMPYGSYKTPEMALENANRLISAGAHMIKLEGGETDIVRHLVTHHIPVCGHLGYTPQSIRSMDSGNVQGQDAASAKQIQNDALALQQAGVCMLVLSMLPATLAARITAQLRIPTIGIGAGRDCDGQVQVLHDMLGISTRKTPTYSRNFLAEHHGIQNAVTAYVAAVKSGEFPASEHGF
jgi:3-methyl-2-oxobutanoate hydroxymethyltransferase